MQGLCASLDRARPAEGSLSPGAPALPCSALPLSAAPALASPGAARREVHLPGVEDRARRAFGSSGERSAGGRTAGSAAGRLVPGRASGPRCLRSRRPPWNSSRASVRKAGSADRCVRYRNAAPAAAAAAVRMRPLPPGAPWPGPPVGAGSRGGVWKARETLVPAAVTGLLPTVSTQRTAGDRGRAYRGQSLAAELEGQGRAGWAAETGPPRPRSQRQVGRALRLAVCVVGPPPSFLPRRLLP